MEVKIKPACEIPSLWDEASTIYSDYNNATGFTPYFSEVASNIAFNNKEKDREYKILDVACGTGPTSTEIIKCLLRNKLKGSISAIDFSKEMLKKCNENIAALGLTKECGVSIETFEMDGQNLTFSDNEFDAAFSMFGLSFFPDKKRGLDEIYRCLKPGGIVFLCGWDIDCINAGSLKKWGDSIEGSLESLRRSSFGNRQQFSDFIKGGGFKNVAIEDATFNKTITTEGTARFFSINPVVIDMSKDKSNEWRYENFKKTLDKIHPDGLINTNALAFIGHGCK